MSFSITLFGSKHFLWKWNDINSFKTKRYWFQRSDEYSVGSLGFCIPGISVNFTWGRK